jgi:hypothetical protein
MVLCSKLRRSNIRTEPSAPHETKTSTLPAQNRTSKTSLSCAMSCVFAVKVGISHIVHVVSILLVIMSFGLRVFQSSEVSGAVCSGVFEFESKASGVSFCSAGSRVLTLDDRVIVLLTLDVGVEGRDHNRRWSPDVASRSVDCFCGIGGSQSIRVTGYEQVASAIRVYSIPKAGSPGFVISCGTICVSTI